MLQHQVHQCSDPTCRFRFPTTGEQRGSDICPLCAAPTLVVAQQESQFVPASINAPAKRHVEAVLDNIRSLNNVGAIFRTADAAGMKRLHLCGITATPDHPKMAKTALGAEKAIDWRYGKNGPELVEQLKADGYAIWVLEGGVSAENLLTVDHFPNRPIALVVGNETAGVDPAIIDSAEKLLAIPMRGSKDSLNVATAFGIAAYALT